MAAAQVIWITGLSGAGKTTVANHVAVSLQQKNINTIKLDGDVLRSVFGSEGQHTREDRLSLARSYSRLCKELAGQGYTVICSTISMFHEIHEWNRNNLPGYLEVYLRVPIDVLEGRDTKGIYVKAKSGDISNVAGVDLKVDEPRSPDILIDNFGVTNAVAATGVILERLCST